MLGSSPLAVAASRRSWLPASLPVSGEPLPHEAQQEGEAPVHQVIERSISVVAHGQLLAIPTLWRTHDGLDHSAGPSINPGPRDDGWLSPVQGWEGGTALRWLPHRAGAAPVQAMSAYSGGMPAGEALGGEVVPEWLARVTRGEMQADACSILADAATDLEEA